VFLAQTILLIVMATLFGGCASEGQVVSGPTEEILQSRAALGDGGVSPFYRYEKPLLGKPGVLLRHEPLDADQSVPGAGKTLRILYTSTNGIDGSSPIVVSGGLFLPPGEAPEGGWPLLAWSHGTVGIADICAPSWTGYVRFHQEHLRHWLENGFAVVASDYQGLGTDGIHPYLATRPEAYSNLDAIRAVRSAGFALSDKVVVAGQSQGAGGAIATAGYAPAYAPELNLRAVVATGVPYFTPEALVAVQALRPRDVPDPMLGYNLLVLTLVESIDPDFDSSDYVSSEMLATAREVSSVCNRDMRKKIKGLGLTYNQVFARSPSEHFKAAYELMQFPTLSIPVPLFVGTGTKDRDTPPRMQAQFVRSACAAGSRISAHVYEGYDHLTTLNRSLEDSIAFAGAAIVGAGVADNCSNLPY